MIVTLEAPIPLLFCCDQWETTQVVPGTFYIGCLKRMYKIRRPKLALFANSGQQQKYNIFGCL